MHGGDENVEKVERNAVFPDIRVGGIPQLKAASSAVKVLIK
jgi:hypothetical protein